MKLVFATNNLHKLEEVRALVGNNFELKNLNDIECHDDIAEIGTTFRENASIKSHYIYNKFKINCFADDSGLEIEALNGAPGVYSARYSKERNDKSNLELVLRNLDGISNRNANFRCVISLVLNSDEYFFEGVVNGTILTEPSGSSGFGYDPIFVPDGYSQSFSEMSAEEKNRISHRGLAIAKLMEFLNRHLTP